MPRMTPYDRIIARLKIVHPGWTERKASMAASGNPDLIRNIKRGRSSFPRGDNLKGLAQVLEVDTDWLTGLSDHDVSASPSKKVGDELEAKVARLKHRGADDAEGQASSSLSMVDGTMHYRPTVPAAIPEVIDAVGAGEGQAQPGSYYALEVGGVVVGHEVSGEWLIPDAFLRGQLHASPRRTLIMRVRGESMRPTLEPDDRVIVSLAENKLGPDGVYVVAIGDDEPQVKRLLRVMIDGELRIRIISDNGNNSHDVHAWDIRIVGRVVGRISRM